VESKRSPSAGGAWTAAGIVIAICLLSTFTLSTRPARTAGTTAAVADGVPGAVAQPGLSSPGARPSGAAGPGRSAGTIPGTSVLGARYDCSKGQNAGATEIGVTAHEIHFAATIVKSGIAKDFLADAQSGMEAVRQKVNRAGGICGRIIKIDYNDDQWDPQTGQRIIEGYIGSKRYFGLAVNPSSQGVRGAIDSGLIRQSQFPVVGSDGQLIDQYQDPWVWPVATSTASVMHVMAQNAYARGARTFGIVWDQNYRFGVEGHAAFVGAVKRLGGKVTADEPVTGGQQSYANQANHFIGNCGGVSSLSNCDFIALLLEPATASRWVGDGGVGDGDHRTKTGIGAPQPLFVNSFARDCGKYCANMWVWTSFKPPIPPFDSEPAVATYRSDLANVSNADANNPHVEGAYVGMLTLVEALKRLGPAPTRIGMKAVLDAMRLDTGLGPVLSFAPGNHYANTGAQAFEAIVNNGSFYVWRYTGSGFITDREVGKDVAS
jgi:ABC-type branched-subunit amino acid transport system substrate-binding protein